MELVYKVKEIKDKMWEQIMVLYIQIIFMYDRIDNINSNYKKFGKKILFNLNQNL